MNYIIDGYNLIFAEPSLAKLLQNHSEDARRNLLVRLSNFHIHKKHNITVVFDGKMGIIGTEKPPPGLNVIFTKNESADAHIIKLIQNSRKPKEMVIVTSDYKDIGHFAQQMGVLVLTSEEFLEQLDQVEKKNKGRPEKPETVSEAEINYWLKQFGKRD